jgi:dCMP deaminase|tara:strand:+ start:1428 stop:1865 length:438 start_codon:yes stop_codon:yes gene_type:complete
MIDKFDHAYMDVAARFGELSSAERLKVGCIIVKDDRIISIGYNGTPAGWDNCCEDVKKSGNTGYGRKLVTKPEVLHAETNAIAKVAKSTESADGAEMYTTHAPCLECSKLIYQSGIKHVLYKEEYRDSDGLTLLKKLGLVITKVE